MSQEAINQQPELEWIQMKKSFDDERAHEEGAKEKFVRKFKQNPMVPIGKKKHIDKFNDIKFSFFSFVHFNRMSCNSCCLIIWII